MPSSKDLKRIFSGDIPGLSAHDDDMVLLAEERGDGDENARHAGHPAKVRRHLAALNPAEAKAGIVAFEPVAAHQEQRRLTFRLRQKVLDQRAADPFDPAGRAPRPAMPARGWHRHGS